MAFALIQGPQQKQGQAPHTPTKKPGDQNKIPPLSVSQKKNHLGRSPDKNQVKKQIEYFKENLKIQLFSISENPSTSENSSTTPPLSNNREVSPTTVPTAEKASSPNEIKRSAGEGGGSETSQTVSQGKQPSLKDSPHIPLPQEGDKAQKQEPVKPQTQPTNIVQEQPTQQAPLIQDKPQQLEKVPSQTSTHQEPVPIQKQSPKIQQEQPTQQAPLAQNEAPLQKQKPDPVQPQTPKTQKQPTHQPSLTHNQTKAPIIEEKPTSVKPQAPTQPTNVHEQKPVKPHTDTSIQQKPTKAKEQLAQKESLIKNKSQKQEQQPESVHSPTDISIEQKPTHVQKQPPEQTPLIKNKTQEQKPVKPHTDTSIQQKPVPIQIQQQSAKIQKEQSAQEKTPLIKHAPQKQEQELTQKIKPSKSLAIDIPSLDNKTPIESIKIASEAFNIIQTSHPQEAPVVAKIIHTVAKLVEPQIPTTLKTIITLIQDAYNQSIPKQGMRAPTTELLLPIVSILHTLLPSDDLPPNPPTKSQSSNPLFPTLFLKEKESPQIVYNTTQKETITLSSPKKKTILPDTNPIPTIKHSSSPSLVAIASTFLQSIVVSLPPEKIQPIFQALRQLEQQYPTFLRQFTPIISHLVQGTLPVLQNQTVLKQTLLLPAIQDIGRLLSRIAAPYTARPETLQPLSILLQHVVQKNPTIYPQILSILNQVPQSELPKTIRVLTVVLKQSPELVQSTLHMLTTLLAKSPPSMALILKIMSQMGTLSQALIPQFNTLIQTLFQAHPAINPALVDKVLVLLGNLAKQVSPELMAKTIDLMSHLATEDLALLEELLDSGLLQNPDTLDTVFKNQKADKSKKGLSTLPSKPEDSPTITSSTNTLVDLFRRLELDNWKVAAEFRQLLASRTT